MPPRRAPVPPTIGPTCDDRRLLGRRPDGRQRWHTVKWVVLALVVIAAVSALTTYLTAPRPGGRMDPGSTSADGALALVSLLRDQGVDVVEAGSVADVERAARPDTLLVVAETYYLVNDDGLRRLAAVPGDRLLVEPVSRTREALAPAIRLAHTFTLGGAPNCAMPEANRAGAVDFSTSDTYEADGRRADHPVLRRRGGALHGRRPHRDRRRKRGLHDELRTAQGGQRRARDEPGRRQAPGHLVRAPERRGRIRCQLRRSPISSPIRSSGSRCSCASPYFSSRCGGPAASARWSPRICRSWSARPKPWKAAAGCTDRVGPATAPPRHCAPPPCNACCRASASDPMRSPTAVTLAIAQRIGGRPERTGAHTVRSAPRHRRGTGRPRPPTGRHRKAGRTVVNQPNPTTTAAADDEEGARNALLRLADRDLQGRRRPGRSGQRPGDRAAVPGPRAARRRARGRQDLAGPHPCRGAATGVQARAVHSRPDARRRHGLAGLRRPHRRVRVPLRARCSPICFSPTRSTEPRRRPRPRCWRRWRNARSASTARPGRCPTRSSSPPPRTRSSTRAPTSCRRRSSTASC